MAAFNISGTTVTKTFNSLSRAIGDVSRTLIVWIFGISITFFAGDKYPNYKWENLNVSAVMI